MQSSYAEGELKLNHPDITITLDIKPGPDDGEHRIGILPLYFTSLSFPATICNMCALWVCVCVLCMCYVEVCVCVCVLLLPHQHQVRPPLYSCVS